jgi:excisionase family DNA binding protein
MPKPLTAPTNVAGLVLTREAAKILGCSMRRVRALAAAGTIKSWALGPKSFGYDVEELKAYRDEKAAGRKAGKVRGSHPQGFSAHVSPTNRVPKKK